MVNQLIQRISATDLARNLASVIDQVRVARLPMTITRGNQDIAQIVPVINSTITLADLSSLVKKNQLTKSQKQTFADDLSSIRQSAMLPDTHWD
jgi:antitoxin (DNA-binding transcriptional repressor) of toxin-antitoxin stability system